MASKRLVLTCLLSFLVELHHFDLFLILLLYCLTLLLVLIVKRRTFLLDHFHRELLFVLIVGVKLGRLV